MFSFHSRLSEREGEWLLRLVAPRPSAPVKLVFDASPFLFKKDEEDFNRIINAHGTDGAHILAKLFPLKINYPHLVFDHFYTEEDHCQYFKNRFGIDPLAEDTGFDPEEERIPKGQTGAGRWTQSGTSESKADPDHHEWQERKTQEEAEAKLEKDSSSEKKNYNNLTETPKNLLENDLSAARLRGHSLKQMLNQSPGIGFKDKLGLDRQQKAWKYFQSLGYKPEQISGILSNIHTESRFDPLAMGDGGHSFGLGQWQKDRLKYFKPVTGKDFTGSSFDDQLKFYGWEMEHGADLQGKTRKKLFKDTTAYQSGFDVTKYFERPGDLNERDKRGKNAELFLEQAMKPENQTMLDIHVNMHELPPSATVNISSKDKGTSIKSIK